MTKEQCGDLYVHTDGNQCISLWTCSWKERLSILLFGNVWLYTYSGYPAELAGVREKANMKKKFQYRNHQPKRIHRGPYNRPETFDERIAREMMQSIRANMEVAFLMASPPCQHHSLKIGEKL
jgi:hypothetical protein